MKPSARATATTTGVLACYVCERMWLKLWCFVWLERDNERSIVVESRKRKKWISCGFKKTQEEGETMKRK
jgi:hypothetical protein